MGKVGVLIGINSVREDFVGNEIINGMRIDCFCEGKGKVENYYFF